MYFVEILFKLLLCKWGVVLLEFLVECLVLLDALLVCGRCWAGCGGYCGFHVYGLVGGFPVCYILI